MNFRVDIIVVGDSKSGHDILDRVASSHAKPKIAFISKVFKNNTTHDYSNVKYVRDEVVYASYRHRLFCCYTKNGDNIFSTHLIIASGLDYEPLVINNEQVPCIHTVDNITTSAKNQSAFFIYKQETDIKFALEVAKRHKKVYLSTKELDLSKNISAANAKKLNKIENLIILPNTNVKKIVFDKDNTPKKIELDNYSEVDCSIIYVKTTCKPALEFVPKKLIERDEKNYPVLTENCESTLVPKCFVVGTCLKKYTKAMEQKLIDIVLKDF